MQRSDEELCDFLEGFLTENRRNLFRKVLEQRTRHITVAVEDVYQQHNASAVIRSCDCFGVQEMHVIEKRNQFQVSKGMAMGAEKWVDLEVHSGVDDCIGALRAKGYRIVATTTT